MKKIISILMLLAVVWIGYGQHYPTGNQNGSTQNRQTVGHLPSVNGMSNKGKSQSKTETTKTENKGAYLPKASNAISNTEKPKTTKSATTTTSQQTTQISQPKEYQAQPVTKTITETVHDTVAIVKEVESKASQMIVSMMQGVLENSFMEMKLENFNTSCVSVGILLNGGYAFLRPLTEVADSYKKYGDSKNCYENLDRIEGRLLNKKSYTTLDKSFITTMYADNSLSVTMPSATNESGVQLAVPTGNVDGFMVWFVKENMNSPLTMDIVPCKVNFNSPLVSIAQPSTTNSVVLAGAFVDMLSTATGIKISLKGVAQQGNGKVWKLAKVTNSQVLQPVAQPEISEPTPTPTPAPAQNTERAVERAAEPTPTPTLTPEPTPEPTPAPAAAPTPTPAATPASSTNTDRSVSTDSGRSSSGSDDRGRSSSDRDRGTSSNSRGTSAGGR